MQKSNSPESLKLATKTMFLTSANLLSEALEGEYCIIIEADYLF